MELNAEQIKNNIERCIEGECGECAYDEHTSCQDYIMHDALALINSQEQRIKELIEERNKVSEKGVEILTRLEEAYLKLESENKKLTEENERLRELATVKEVEKEIVRKETRADTVRNMQERLKEKIHKSVYQYWNEGGGGYYLAEDVDGDIAQIAKEMLEGE